MSAADPPLLEGRALADALATLPGWECRGSAIEKTFRFADFHRTMAFVNAVAYLAHQADHHPDLGVHYDRCVVRCTTHDAGGITASDIRLAGCVEALVG